MDANASALKLASSALVGGLVGALGVYAYTKLCDCTTASKHQAQPQVVLDAPPHPNEEIFNEQMNRTMLFYGEDKFVNIKNAFVVVVGVGGVGSAAAHVLLRSGIGRLRLIDPDLVTLSSLNRNSVAQRKDVGRTKVQVLTDYFQRISPETKVESFETFFSEELAPTLLAGNPDFVLDCIDQRDAKVGLMAYCKNNNLKIISAFGAGSAHDPTKINVCDLKDSFGCVFGKTIRRYLRMRGIHSGMLVVCSTEIEKKKQIPLTEEEVKIAMRLSEALEFRKLEWQCRFPAYLYLLANTFFSTSSNIFGTVMANCVLSHLVGLPVVYEEEKRVPGGQMGAQRIYKLLIKYELDVYHIAPTVTKTVVNVNEISQLLDECNNTSLISGETKGAGRVARWRVGQKPTLSNLVYLVGEEEFKTHVKLTTSVEEHYPKEIVERVDQFLAKLK